MTSLLVVSGPSGVGKSVLVEKLLAEFPRIRFSVSCTTRSIRPGEAHGVNYFFLSREQFEADIAAGRFLEHAEFNGHRYGTHLDQLEHAQSAGLDLLLDIEVRGARQLQEAGREAVYIFILPPDYPTLAGRLRNRGTEPEQVVEKRLARAAEDVSQIHLYDFIIVNDNLNYAYEQLRAVYLAERSRRVNRLPEIEAVLNSFPKIPSPE
jgi:guanylate kinase